MQCAGSIKRAVERVEGTLNVSVDLGGRFVEFETSRPVSIERIKAAIVSEGFSLEGNVP
jgi:copper chaperone CopZ